VGGKKLGNTFSITQPATSENGGSEKIGKVLPTGEFKKKKSSVPREKKTRRQTPEPRKSTHRWGLSSDLSNGKKKNTGSKKFGTKHLPG